MGQPNYGEFPTFPDEEEQRDAAAANAAAAACNASGAAGEPCGPVPAGRPCPGAAGLHGSMKSSQQWRRESVTIIEGVEEPGKEGRAGLHSLCFNWDRLIGTILKSGDM